MRGCMRKHRVHEVLAFCQRGSLTELNLSGNQLTGAKYVKESKLTSFIGSNFPSGSKRAQGLKRLARARCQLALKTRLFTPK